MLITDEMKGKKMANDAIFSGPNGNARKCGAKEFLVPLSVLLTWQCF